MCLAVFGHIIQFGNGRWDGTKDISSCDVKEQLISVSPEQKEAPVQCFHLFEMVG